MQRTVQGIYLAGMSCGAVWSVVTPIALFALHCDVCNVLVKRQSILPTLEAFHKATATEEVDTQEQVDLGCLVLGAGRRNPSEPEGHCYQMACH